MSALASLKLARDLSEAIYEASRTDNLDLLSSLERERSELLSSRIDFSGLNRLEKQDIPTATSLLKEILELNEKARALIEPWHQDVKAYLDRLDENHRRHHPVDDAG